MNKKFFLIYIFLSLIFQQEILVTKEWDSSKNSIDQKILFQYSYYNTAKGLQYNGWYIDNNANIWNLEGIQHWLAEQGNIITKKNETIYYNSDSLNEIYIECRDTIITKINLDSLNHYYQLINDASYGEYSEPEITSNDWGSFIYGCLYYDNQEKKYRKVILSLFGDWTSKNLDSNAIKLDNWLKRLNQTVVGIEKNEVSFATMYNLSNFPNPFNLSTNIVYSIPNSNFVTIKVYDLLGREVQTLVNEFQKANTYIVTFNADGISSGIYLYRLQVGNDFVEMKRMLFLK